MRLASAPESCFSHCSLQLRVTSRVQTMSFRFARLRILPIPLFLHWAQSPAPSSPLFLSSARSRCTRICAPTRLFLDSRRSRYRTFAILQFFVTTLCFMYKLRMSTVKIISFLQSIIFLNRADLILNYDFSKFILKKYLEKIIDACSNLPIRFKNSLFSQRRYY